MCRMIIRDIDLDPHSYMTLVPVLAWVVSGAALLAIEPHASAPARPDNQR
jgi:hypothetical protein